MPNNDFDPNPISPAAGTGDTKRMQAVTIALGDDFGTAVVQGGGITIELRDNGDVTVQTNGNVGLRPAARIEPKPGDEMEDGTTYAGTSPDTGKPMYTTPKNAPGTYTFNEAAKYAKNLDAHGHHDFHVPSKGELNVLWENRNKGKLKGTFNETGSDPAGWYWSSSQFNIGNAWAQRFSDGNRYNYGKGFDSSLRCVR
jgi:hypothetical protein